MPDHMKKTQKFDKAQIGKMHVNFCKNEDVRNTEKKA